MAGLLFVLDPENPHVEAVLTRCIERIRAEARIGKREVVISEPVRTLEQNSRLWALLTDISRQVEWLVNGKAQLLKPEEWKAIFTAALRSDKRIAQGIDGGFVFLGESTSRMTKREHRDLTTLIEAFGDERAVRWTDPKPLPEPH